MTDNKRTFEPKGDKNLNKEEAKKDFKETSENIKDAFENNGEALKEDLEKTGDNIKEEYEESKENIKKGIEETKIDLADNVNKAKEEVEDDFDQFNKNNEFNKNNDFNKSNEANKEKVEQRDDKKVKSANTRQNTAKYRDKKANNLEETKPFYANFWFWIILVIIIWALWKFGLNKESTSALYQGIENQIFALAL